MIIAMKNGQMSKPGAKTAVSPKSVSAGSVGAKSEALFHEEGDAWLDSYLPYQIYRVSSLMNGRLQGQLRAMGVNLSQWRVLSVLQAHGRCNLSRIVDLTLMEQPTVSRVVANLQEEGMIDRRVSAGDTRVMEVALTAKGVAVFQDILPTAVRRQRAALEGLSKTDLAVVRTTLARIEANIARDI
jgi:DNA-binding MarR family transcriptional regulator